MLVPLALIGLSESYVVGFPGGKPREIQTPVRVRVSQSLTAARCCRFRRMRARLRRFANQITCCSPRSIGVLSSTALDGKIRQATPQHLKLHLGFQPQSIVGLCKLELRYVVIHTGRASELRDVARDAQNSGNVKLVGRFGDDYLFRIVILL